VCCNICFNSSGEPIPYPPHPRSIAPLSQTTKADGKTASDTASSKPQQQQKKKNEPKVNIAKMSVEQIQKLKARAERFGNTELLR
jgi:hypothetical protein